MPEFVNSSVWSPAGTRLALGTTVCPRSAKNSTNRDRISAAERYGIAVCSVGLAIGAMVANGDRPTWPAVDPDVGATVVSPAAALAAGAAAPRAGDGRPDERAGDEPAEEPARAVGVAAQELGRGPPSEPSGRGAGSAAAPSAGSIGPPSADLLRLRAERREDRDDADADPGQDRGRDQREVADGEDRRRRAGRRSPPRPTRRARPRCRSAAAARRRRRGSGRRARCSASPTSSASGSAGPIVTRRPRPARAPHRLACPTRVAGAAIRPPPRHRSPSYRTHACPGAIAHTGASVSTIQRPPRAGSRRRSPAGSSRRRAAPGGGSGPGRGTGARPRRPSRPPGGSPATNVPPSSGIVRVSRSSRRPRTMAFVAGSMRET